VGVVLGAHGLYIYCYFKVASFLGTRTADAAMASSSLSTQEYLSRLFLAWDVPDQFRDWVLWVTVKGLESWVVPAVIIVAGIFLLRVQKVCKVHA
jgi:hypothetical protein